MLTIDRHRGLGVGLGGRVHTTFQHASLLGRRGVADSSTFLLWSSLGTESRRNCCRVTEHHPRPNSLHLLNTLISSILEWLLLAAWCRPWSRSTSPLWEVGLNDLLGSGLCLSSDDLAFFVWVAPAGYWAVGSRGDGGGGVLNVSRWCWYRHRSLTRTERRLRLVIERWDRGMNAYLFLGMGRDFNIVPIKAM